MALYKNILLVDDDPEDREIFLECIGMIDHSIHCFSAADGEKAIQLLNNDILNKPDLIFLDVNMPFLNGKQTLERMKSNSDLRNIPVIMYSTSFSIQDETDIRHLGAAELLIKPTAFDVLVSSLKGILERRW